MQGHFNVRMSANGGFIITHYLSSSQLGKEYIFENAEEAAAFVRSRMVAAQDLGTTEEPEV